MKQATIKGFFNPRHEGDQFKGLNSTIEGEVADTVISDLPTFLQKAGRDYYIKKVPAGVCDPTGAVNENGSVVPGWIEVENQFHLVRSSDHRVVSPSTVTKQYAPLSLVDIAEELQPWCDQGWATPDGVYEGRGGALEILSLRLDAGGIEIPDEDFMHYVVFQNPHGSGGTAKGKIISWRIVCANTFAAAVSATADFAITHRAAAGDHEEQQQIMTGRVRDAVSAWEKAQEHIRSLSTRVNALQQVPLQLSDAKELTNRLFGIDNEEKASKRTLNRRDAVLYGFNTPKIGRAHV